MYDVVIIWWWAAGLFASIRLPKTLSKLILEKNPNPWVKVLLSGWERANLSNASIDVENDYFSQNKKAIISVYNRFTNEDTIKFFNSNKIDVVEENRKRLILKSWDSKELLTFLLRKSKENNTLLKTNSEVIKIEKEWDIFLITIKSWEVIKSKNVIISSWWKSFFQVWTTGDGYNFASDFWIDVVTPSRWLCGLVTKKDLSIISWVSANLSLEIYYKEIWKKSLVYEEKWPLLFTHFWVSWPIIFNSSVAISNYISTLSKKQIQSNAPDFLLKIEFHLEITPKSVKKFFDLEEENKTIILELQEFRSWKEAKVTVGWININELDKYMQAKKVPGLFFIWEVVDVTWKTWWYNLQWAWSSANACSEFFIN